MSELDNVEYGDLSRPGLVRLSHQRFGADIDPIHTNNAVIRESLAAGEWRGAVVGAARPSLPVRVVVPVADAERLADASQSTVTMAKTEAGRDVAVIDSFDFQSMIPARKIFDTYHARKMDGRTDVEIMEVALLNGQNVLLQSDAGTGKNHLIEAVCAKLGRPQVAVSLSGGATVEDLVGQYVLVQGSTVWTDGIMTTLFRPTGMGGVFTADEVNACPPEITFVCHQATDHRRTLVLAQRGREVIRAHKQFSFIGTANPDYIGTKALNPAFRSRFNVKLQLDYDPVIEAQILKGGWDLDNGLHIPGAKSRTVKALLGLASKLRDQYRNPSREISIPFDTRMLKDYVTNSHLHGEHIARQSLINSFDLLEQVAVREAVSLHLDSPMASDNDPFSDTEMGTNG